MNKVVLNETLRSALNGLNQEVEVCDADGATVGHFVPEETYQRFLTAWVESRCPYSEEKLRRFEAEPGGSSLEEVWKELGVAR